MKSRLAYIFAVLLVIPIGLGVRSIELPTWIHFWLGDALYATMMYFIVSALVPQWKISRRFTLSLLLCFGIEFSQLYQADWIKAIRNTRLGAVTLGRGFMWSDLLAYFGGALFGAAIDKFSQAARRSKQAYFL